MPKKLSRSSFRTDEAREAMMAKHQVQAIVAMILNETDQFHLLNMDANCHGHSAVLLDMWRNLRVAISEDEATPEEVHAMAKAFVAIHDNDLNPNKVKTVEEVNMSSAANYPTGFKEFLQRIFSRLDENNVIFPGLAFSSTQAATRFYERLGTNYNYVDQPTYASLPADADPDPKNLRNHIWELRARIAELSTSWLYAGAWDRTTSAYQTARPRKYIPMDGHLKAQQWDVFEDQVAEALYFGRSKVVGKDGSEVGVQYVFPQMAAILQQEFAAGADMTGFVRLIEMSPIRSVSKESIARPVIVLENEGTDTVVRDEATGEILKLDGTEPYQPPSRVLTQTPLADHDTMATSECHHTYTQDDVVPLLWKPDETTGRYVLVDEHQISAQRANKANLGHLAFRYRLTSNDDDGLNACGRAGMLKALGSPDYDIATIIMTFMASHDAVTGRAIDSEKIHKEQARFYQSICKPQEVMMPSNPYLFPAYKLAVKHDKSGLSLYNLFKMCEAATQERGIGQAMEFKRLSLKDYLWQRRSEAADFLLKHIKPLSFNEAKTICDQLKENYRKGGDKSIGPYIVRVGEDARDCLSRATATLIASSGKATARKLHDELYDDKLGAEEGYEGWQ
jgi:hypothetical protein